MHRKMIKHIVELDNTDIMRRLEHLFVEMIDDIKLYNHDKYDEIEYKLYCIAYGKHLTEEVAKSWVHSMKHKDGTIGEHWTIEQTSQYSGKHDKNDWYAAMNMMYSDYCNPKFDNNIYIELANDYLNDPDAPEDKLLRYYMLVIK